MHYAWRVFTRTTAKLLMKTLALLGYVLLSIFLFIMNTIFFFYHFVAIPAAVLGIIVSIYSYMADGFSSGIFWLILCSVAVVPLYFLLPKIPPVLDTFKETMKDYILAPLFIKSPVKYTLD